MSHLLDTTLRHDDGLAAWELYQRAVLAQDSRHTDVARSISVSQEPPTATLLPLFGFRRTIETTPPFLLERNKKLPRQYEAWTVEPAVRSFITRLRAEVQKAIVREPGNDGTLTEVATATALEDAWHRASHSLTLPEALRAELAMATHIGAVLADRTIGCPWSLAEDGTGIRRVLPAHPLRLPPRRDPPWASYGKGDRTTNVECVAWVVLPAGDPYTDSPQDEILMASFCGYQKLCKGIWAALMDRKRSLVSLPYLAEQYGRTSVFYRSVRRLEGKRRYQTFWNERPLNRFGKAHIVIEAMEACRPTIGAPFAHIVGADGTADYMRFVRQLTRALRLPVRPKWARELWQLASTEDKARGRPALITPLPAFGCAAFWVRADLDAAWAQIVATLAGARAQHAGTIERTGELTITSSSVAVAPLSDDEDDDLSLAA
jgi:hypothetical protein